MELSDLRAFLAIAQFGSLRMAAQAQHQSPSALSKALRRLEMQLQTTLFDRIGTGIRLNVQGERLREHANALVARADLAEREFKGAQHQLKCRIAGPSVLQWRFAGMLGKLLSSRFANSVLALESLFEDAAVAALLRGEVDFALVSAAAVSGAMDASLQTLCIGEIAMQLAASLSHPLSGSPDQPSGKPVHHRWQSVVEHPFACPRRSLFCGLERGARADGWRDDQLPRKIHYWSDDVLVLLGLVRAGNALAYLPDFMLDQHQLVRVQVLDCPYRCLEQAHLVWRPHRLVSWHNVLLEQLKNCEALNENPI